jgi:hypothetical protein
MKQLNDARAPRGTTALALCTLLALCLCATRSSAQGQPLVAPVESEPQATPATSPPSSDSSALAQAAEATPTAKVFTRSDAQLTQAFRSFGCESSELLEHENVWYAACGAAGVFVAVVSDGGLVLREVRQTQGSARGLFVRSAAVWVEATRTEALPLAQLSVRDVRAPSSTASGAAPVANAVAREQSASGSVIAIRALEATVSLGQNAGLKTGDRVEIYRRVSPNEDQDLGEREESLAVGEVIALSDERARVALGLGEVVPVGALARASMRQVTGSTIAPSRRGGLLAIEGTLRPFLPIETLSFATLGDIALTYRLHAPVYVRAELRPFGVIVGDVRNSGAFGGFVSAGYDHQFFAVGLGVGALLNGEQTYTWNGQQSVVSRDEGLDFAVTQNARLGAVDGLHLSITNAFALDASNDRWRFGFFEGSAQIPLGTRTWLLTSGGGGRRAAYFFAELGLRRLVAGDGGPQSLFLKPAVGLAGIDSREQELSEFYIGPMVAAHAEWRM